MCLVGRAGKGISGGVIDRMEEIVCRRGRCKGENGGSSGVYLEAFACAAKHACACLPDWISLWWMTSRSRSPERTLP